MSTPLEILKRSLKDDSLAESLLTALRAGGFVCVPFEPTAPMIKEAWAYADDNDLYYAWKSMIEAYLRDEGEENPVA